MTYRDDRDADQARIAALEDELAQAKDRIAELEGHRDQALVLSSRGELAAGARRSAATRWLGAPLELELTRTFDRPYPTDRFEDLLAMIRNIAREFGIAEVLRTSLTWRAMGRQGPSASLSAMISVRDGKTTLIVRERLHQLAGAIFGGVGGGLGGGGIALPVFATAAIPLLAPVFFLGWFGGVYAGTRLAFKRIARKRAELIQQLFDALVAAIEAS